MIHTLLRRCTVARCTIARCTIARCTVAGCNLHARRLSAGAAVAVMVMVCLWLALSKAGFAQVYSGTTAQGMPTTQPTTDDTRVYTLTGSVVNSMTGEPIVRALVQIMGQNSPRAAFTDREGNFRFANMHAMTGSLMAVKPGFYGNDRANACR